jgi:hypothetical protein
MIRSIRILVGGVPERPVDFYRIFILIFRTLFCDCWYQQSANPED